MTEGPVPEPTAPPALVTRYRVEGLLALAAVASSFLVWAPFANDMATVYKVWDGPNYLTIAHDGYDVKAANPLMAFTHETSYFLVHLPVYPALVRAFSFVGWQRSLLLVNVLAAAFAAVLFYRLARDDWQLPQPAWLTVVFLFVTPRWLMFRSTGSTEGTYTAFLLLAILLFSRGRTGWAAAAAGLATLTRTPGLMLAPAFGVVLLQRRRWKEIPWLVLVPLPLLAYFGFCAAKTGNFLAYFGPHGDKIKTLVPFAFLSRFFELGLYHQAEFYILLALVYVVGVSRIREFEVLFVYGIFEILLLLFVATEDWSRYWLAMAPFALVVGYRDILVAKGFKAVFPAYVLMSYVYCWGTIPITGAPREMYLHLLYHLDLKEELLPYLPKSPIR